MNNVNENKKKDIELIKHFIKDLSFENPQTINNHNAEYNNNNKIDVNMDVINEPYENNHFSLILKYNIDCLSKKNNRKLFHLELEYLGFFKILINGTTDQKSLSEHALNEIFPFAKEIIEDLTRKGGSVPILLNSVDLSLVKINS